MTDLMNCSRILRTVGLLCAVIGGSLASNAHASSSGVVWNAFFGGDNALLTAKSVRSFLGSDEVTETLLLTGNCERGRGSVYLTISYAQRNIPALGQQASLVINLEGGSPVYVEGRLDRLATVNARDDRVRFGFNLPVTSPLFTSLMDERTRNFPRIVHTPSGTGTPLHIYGQNRSKLAEFLQFCGAQAGQTTVQKPARQFQPQLAACRRLILGPNPWLGDGQPSQYPANLVEQLCAPDEANEQPATCFHYIMAEKVDWDHTSNWNARWGSDNAANLCAYSQDWVNTITCFQQQIDNGVRWEDALSLCDAR